MKSRETKSMGGAGPPRRPAGAAADGPPDTLDERMLSVLSAYGVPPVEKVNPSCFRLKGVPMAPSSASPAPTSFCGGYPRASRGQGPSRFSSMKTWPTRGRTGSLPSRWAP